MKACVAASASLTGHDVANQDFETAAAVVAIPVFMSQFFMDADGVLRVTPRAATDRYPHGFVLPGSVELLVL